jgi:hypothetical protein
MRFGQRELKVTEVEYVKENNKQTRGNYALNIQSFILK